MKLMLFDDWKLGVLKGDRVVDVTRAVPDAERMPKTPLGGEAVMESVIENFDGLRSKFESIVSQEGGVPMSEVKVRPPLPRPPNALCAFSNYQDRDTTEPRPPVSERLASLFRAFRRSAPSTPERLIGPLPASTSKSANAGILM